MTDKSNDMTAMIPRNTGEIDISANAAAAIAEVQAAYVMAMKNPRNIFEARSRMLEACDRKRFSEKARYRRPVGKDRYGNEVFAEGFSVHFARPAAVMMRNILINTGVLYEDDKIRKVVARATDIEANVAYTKEAVVEKTIERSSGKGREVISQRTNSYNKTTYLVVAYPHEVDLKAAKVTAILLRDCVIPLIPPDLLEEVEEKIVEVLSSEMENDPITARKKLVDSFREQGVLPNQLLEYLGHPIEEMSPKEYVDLRAVYLALRDGQARWEDYVDGKESSADRANLKTDDLKVGDPTSHSDVTDAPGTPPEDGQKELSDSDKADIRLDEICDGSLPVEISEYFDKKAVAKALIFDHYKIDSAAQLSEVQFKGLAKYLKSPAFLDRCREEQLIK